MKKYKIMVELEIDVEPSGVKDFEKEVLEDLPFLGAVGETENGRTIRRATVKVVDTVENRSVLDVVAVA